MNFYLLFLGLYSLCIFPVTVKFELQIGPRLAGRLRIKAAAIQLDEKRFRLFRQLGKVDEKEEKEKEREASQPNLADAFLQMDPVMVGCVLSPSFWKKVLQFIRCRVVSVRVRVAMEDAASTALCYTSLQVLADTLKKIGVRLPASHFSAEADFSGKGSQTVIRGILFLRLGSIALVASRFLREYQKRKGALKDEKAIEEEEHATASNR